MASLTIKLHDDFELVFSSAKWNEAIASAGTTKAPGSELHALYRFSEDSTEVLLDNGTDTKPLSIDEHYQGTPFFFDNVDYDVWLKLGPECKHPKVEAESQAWEKAFTPHGNILTAGINFVNDIGRFDFVFTYEKNGAPRRFVFVGEVLSQKLDYHHDWEVIFNDIDTKYPLLAADYLKRTYHSFDYDPKADPETTPGLIWWNLFRSEKTKMLDGARLIVDRPRRRLSRTEDYRRADRLTILSPQLENEFTEHGKEVAHLYRIERDTSTHDTVENRFVKHALGEVLRKYESLCTRITHEYGEKLSADAKAKMEADKVEFRSILSHPFFRGVGRFTGLKQESLVLRQAPGYSTVARSYAILNASHMLYDGTRRLETKNIAEMYEIWCFLKLENIIEAGCKAGGLDIEVDENYRMLDERFVQNLETGFESQVVFRTKGDNPMELARLVYNPDITRKPRKETGLPDLRVPTGLTKNSSQAPDFVLRLTKTYQGQEDFKVTYLFDAKYRVEKREHGKAYSSPPQDAIDQMHRYRDAIYYSEKDTGTDEKLKKEVVGGYILFPGECDEGERPEYQRSIDSVNIGAFPFKPGEESDVTRLEEFVKELVDKKVDDHLMGKPSQAHKGTELVQEGMSNVEDITQIIAVYPRKFASLVEQTGFCPCNVNLCQNPERVKLVITPHVKGAEMFKVVSGGVLKKNIKVDEVPSPLKELLQEHPKFANETYHMWQVEKL